MSTFDERNEKWDGYKREFWQVHSRSSSPRLWRVWTEGNTIHYEWGQVGGALQTANETHQGVNLGKKNAMSGEVYALDRAREMCRKKHREGYREVGCVGGQTAMKNDGSPVFLDPVVERNINFDDLPHSLCFYKPDNSMGAGITKKANAGGVWYSRKRNGLAYILARGEAHPRMYSRRMHRQHDDEVGGALTWNDRFPHLIEAAAKIMPPNSIMLGELVMDRQGQDDFKAVQSYTKSLTQQSLEDQKKFGYPSFYIWDIAFWDSQDFVSQLPVRARYEFIHELDLSQHLIPVQYFYSSYFPTPQHAIDYAKECDWEGWVVVDPEGVYGDKAYNYKGKPDRPGSVCAKLKPAYEDDFVAYWDPSKGWGELSKKGRYEGGVKSVALFQYNSQGELVYISNVSSGLSEDLKSSLSDPSLYPQVWKVEFTDRRYKSKGDDTNALDFARYIEKRDDKKPEECINPEL
jgi:predicted DNA-binding WGR domain protein